MKYGDQTVIERKIEQDAIMMFRKKKEETIEGFTGYFEFLRPEFPSKVFYEGEIYNSVAHAYTAARIDPSDAVTRRRVLKAPTYKDMLEISQNVETSP